MTLQKAIELRISGKGEEAYVMIKALLQDNPNDAYINYQMAWTCDSLGYDIEAVQYYEQAMHFGFEDDEIEHLDWYSSNWIAQQHQDAVLEAETLETQASEIEALETDTLETEIIGANSIEEEIMEAERIAAEVLGVTGISAETIATEMLSLDNVEPSYNALTTTDQQDALQEENSAESPLEPKPKRNFTAYTEEKKAELLAPIIVRLTELFVTTGLTEEEILNYAYAIRDEVSKNQEVMDQIATTHAAQALLGDLPMAIISAIHGYRETYPKQMEQLFSNTYKAHKFNQAMLELLKIELGEC